MAKPTLPDYQTLIQAGINPKTGRPLRMEKPEGKANIKKVLRILDEQNAVNRYTWFNLPGKLTSQDLERLLYYKGQLAFFYFPELNEFYFMPFALDGTIDFYGRYNTIHPVPMADGVDETTMSENNRRVLASQRALLSTKRLDVVYDVPYEDEELDPTKCCVILHDYTRQLSQTIIARQQLQDGVLDIMAECIPFMRTALINGTGIQAMRVNNQDEYSNVTALNNTIINSALTGDRFLAALGNMDFQELSGGEISKSEEFMMAMQSIDNFRLSLYGLDNGGLFQKKSHMLEAEQEMNMGNLNLVLQDGLSIRQHFCDVVNSLFNLGISCEISETVINADLNGDGIVADEQDQSGEYPGEQDSMSVEE